MTNLPGTHTRQLSVALSTRARISDHNPLAVICVSLSPLVPAQAARDHNLLAVVCVGPEVVWEEVLMVEAAPGDKRETEVETESSVRRGGAPMGCKSTQSSIPS